MVDDVVLNKAAVIERCLARIDAEYVGHEDSLETDLTRQDSIILNLLRACEAAIDLAMHETRILKLGIPRQTREAFDLLAGAGVLDAALSGRMKAMVGFRNIAVHDYQALDLRIVRAIVEERLDDFHAFVKAMLERA